MTNTQLPVLFIHGLWLHATSWNPWIEKFTAEGYAPTAPGWPGDPDTVAEARENPESIADHGIDDVVAHYAGIIRGMDSLPILIGHSFGGMIARSSSGRTWAGPRSRSTPLRSRVCSRCHCPRSGPRCRCSKKTRPTSTARCR